jgi:hypothetical protein
VARAYVLGYVSGGVSKWNVVVYRVLSIVMGLDGVVCCYLWGYSLSCWYIVLFWGLFCSMPNSFICVSRLLARNVWYFSRLFRNFPFLAFLRIVSVLSMLPCVCPVSNICRGYPESGRLLRMAWISSLYLVLMFCLFARYIFFGGGHSR